MSLEVSLIEQARMRLACLFLLSVAPAFAIFDNWQEVIHDATHSNLWNVSFGDRALVAVGEQGTIVTFNYDAAGWVPRSSGSSEWLVGVGHGAGRFVAVGDRGTILTSDDRGATWTPRVSATSIRLNAVVHGNGLWLAVGEQGVVLVSPDGSTWTPRPRLGDGTQFLRALAFGQGRFLIGGARGALYTSTDAVTFTAVPLATTADIEGAAITASRFIVVGSNGLRASATSLGTWAMDNVPPHTYRAVTPRNAEEVSAVGNGVASAFVLNQPAGSWFAAFPPRPFPLPFLATSVVRGDNEVIAVGFGGSIARSSISTYLPQIVRHASRQVVHGTDVRFSLLSDREVLAYQWTRNGADIAGATHSELVLRNVTTADAATYGLRFTAPSGPVTRDTPPLQVIPAGVPDILDPTFAPSLPALPSQVIPLADGKLLVAGPFDLGAGNLKPYRILRLQADGSVDPTFATGSDAPVFGSIGSIVVAADGRIYVFPPVPPVEASPFAPSSPIQRLLPNGRADPTPIEPGSAPPAPISRGPHGVESRLELSNVTYTAIASPTPATSTIFFNSSFPGYTSPAPSPTPWWAGFSYGYRPDGALWQLRSDQSLNSTSWPFRGRLYTSVGLPDRGAFATLPDLSFFSIRAVSSDGALYAVTSSDGSAVLPAFVRLRPITGRVGRLSNLSVRTFASAGPATPLIVGFVTAGAGETRALLRAVGPGLADFGVTDAMPDPTLVLVSGGSLRASNDQWAPALAARFGSLGAFSLASGSRDAALESVISAGDYSAILAAAPGTAAGTALVELYESGAPEAPRRFVNLSARNIVRPNQPLIAGFNVTGEVPMRLLIRAAGPTLRSFGIDDALANPKLTLFSGATPLYENDDWSALNPTLSGSNADTGAFVFPRDSRDAAMLVTLAPGSYTAVLETADNTAGTALIEVYGIP